MIENYRELTTVALKVRRDEMRDRYNRVSRSSYQLRLTRDLEDEIGRVEAELLRRKRKARGL